MNVLHFFTSYLPPTENWAYNLLRSAPGACHHVFARRYVPSTFHDSSFRFLQLPGGFQQSAEPLYAGFGAFKHTLLSLIPRGTERMIASAANRSGIDLLHAHFAHNGWRYRRVSEALRIPLVISFYGYDYEYLPYTNPSWKARYRTLFSTASMFLCEGRFGAGKLVEMGCPEEKVRVQHLGISTAAVPFVRREKLPGTLRLVQIAWLNEKKGQIEALQAFAKIAEQCPQATLTFVGKEKAGRGRPGIRRELVHTIAQLGLSNRVELIESVDYDKLHDFLRGYHVFIHPSRYSQKRDCEGGAPVVLLDAQATGMPVISTTHCDIPEEVLHSRTGMLAPEDDIEMLAEHIRLFYRMDQGRYDAFAAAARGHVEHHYDLKQCGRRLTGHYQTLTA